MADSVITQNPGKEIDSDVREISNRHLVAEPLLSDSVDVRLHEHKNFWRAAIETAGFNIGLWAFDRYIQKGHFAYISWTSIKENFKHGFEWDNDHLSTNMFQWL